MTTTATPAKEAISLLDAKLAEWSQAERSLVSTGEAVDLALDLRNILGERADTNV